MAIRYSSSSGVPFGTSSDRPSSPQIGQTFYNGTLGVQEIYTSSGWLPATGANDFNVALTGSNTTATFTKEYFSGAYTITSALADSTYDIYVYSSDGSLAGYTKTPSLVATNNFNKIVILGGTQGDLLSFSYKTTFSTTAENNEVLAGPYLSYATPTSMPNIDSTTTLIGGNFATDVQVFFSGSGYSSTQAKNVVRSSSTQIIATRPDNFPVGTYTITVINPGVTSPTGSSSHILTNAVTAGSTPSWNTISPLPSYTSASYSTTLSASDSDGTIVSYTITSGSLPTGFSLNSSTGVISGTATQFTSNTFTVRATDQGGNYVDRQFVLSTLGASTGGTITSISGYKVHKFLYADSGTNFTAGASGTVEYLIVGGGGAGGSWVGGGGGAGGVLTGTCSVTAGTNYQIIVGNGGLGVVGVQAGSNNGASGGNSSFNSLVAYGGGVGGRQNSPVASSSGGSGGGGSYGLAGASGTAGQGNSGGNGVGAACDSAGGGGGAGGPGDSGTNNINARGSYGGVGIQSSITGTSLWYAAGGQGGEYCAYPGTGYSQNGIGGTSGPNGGGTDSVGTAGAANTGSGGGGGGTGNNSAGGSGGTGIVIIRYSI